VLKQGPLEGPLEGRYAKRPCEAPCETSRCSCKMFHKVQLQDVSQGAVACETSCNCTLQLHLAIK
jgi:hypothetical protein